MKWVKSISRKREEKREKVSVNNGQATLATATIGGARKPHGPTFLFVFQAVKTWKKSSRHLPLHKRTVQFTNYHKLAI